MDENCSNEITDLFRTYTRSNVSVLNYFTLLETLLHGIASISTYSSANSSRISVFRYGWLSRNRMDLWKNSYF